MAAKINVTPKTVLVKVRKEDLEGMFDILVVK